ncbi:MAG: hypothetical protein JSW59_18200 [Phycisphaerales bacterium]|nr:MAG: hypothetical protein JSW59_18200 [Phycisphaerales bacterium]
MNTFWLKIAGLAIAVVIGIVVIGSLTGGDSQPKEPQTTFYDKAAEDQRRFLTEPQPLEEQEPEPVAEQEPRADSNQAVVPAPPSPRPAEQAKPTIVYCKPLSEIDQIEAQRLLNVAAPGYSLGSLQVGYKLMIQNCRQVLRKWPDSTYAYRAKVMIIEMPERHRQRYNVTADELDLSTFAKPREGTKPFIVEELN